MFKVKVNGKWDYDIEKKGEKLQINNKIADWDLIHTGDGRYHIILDNRSYNAELINVDPETKIFTIKVNNNVHQVDVKDKYDLLLKQLGLEDLNQTKINDIKAPMPGLVLKILSKEGQEIKKGESVIILEAMKMENVLKSPGDGKIKTIKVKTGQAVEKNQVLLELE